MRRKVFHLHLLDPLLLLSRPTPDCHEQRELQQHEPAGGGGAEVQPGSAAQAHMGGGCGEIHCSKICHFTKKY